MSSSGPYGKPWNWILKSFKKRASVSARHMLHNYSTLNVGTIDQFTHRLVRTFTKDLDLEDNPFEIRLDLDAMIKEALDSLYSSIGEYPGLKESFVALVNDRLSKDKGHNPDRDLHKEGKTALTKTTGSTWRHFPNRKGC